MPASKPHRDPLDAELVGLDLQKRHPPGLYKVLVYPLALRSGFSLPTGEGALIELEGCNNGLHQAAVGKQSHHRNHQPLRGLCMR